MRLFHKNAFAVLSCAIFLAVAFLPGCGCDDDSDGDETEVNANGLIRCVDCDDVLRWVRIVAMEDMKRQINRNITDAERWYGDGMGDDISDGWDDDGDWDDDFSGDDDAPVSDDDGSETGDNDNGGDDEGQNYSDTNTQEEDVDEADIVKTDGDQIYLLSGGMLIIFDPTDAGEVAEVSRHDIEGRTLEMFVHNGYVVVFSNLSAQSLPEYVWPDVPREEINWDILLLTIIDASNTSTPRTIRKFYAEGSYISSRRIDDAVRMAIVTHPAGPSAETYIDPWNFMDDEWNLDEDALRQAYYELMEQNMAAIDEATLEDWLPRYFDDQMDDNPRSGFLSDCEDFFHPVDPMGRSVSTLMTLLLNDPLAKQPDIALLADGQMIYSSVDALYMAGEADTAYEWFDEQSLQSSWIHKFALSSDEQPEYTGSVKVDGFVLNQFSMGEYQGYLRVATTTGWWGETLNNHVFVIGQSDERLDVVGQIRDIAPGENIRSARFMGAKGYVVTFEQTDPLFTLDMSVPTDPKLVGELHIPGFSTYIHPFDDNHILTIGEDGDEWGSTGGVVLQLFDISNYAEPTVAYGEVVAEGWDADSAALYDHKAFLYYEKLDLLAIPIKDYGWDNYYDDDFDDDEPLDLPGVDPVTDDDEPLPPADDDDDTVDDDDDDDDDYPEQAFSGVYVYEITPENGFVLKGKIEHTDYEAEEGSEWYGDLPVVRRSVVIEPFLYTISDAALVVTRIENLEDLFSEDLPFESPWQDDYWGDDDMEDVEGEGWSDDNWDN
jgi:Beta propeller domain